MNWAPLKIKKMGTMDTALAEREESPAGVSLSPEPQTSSVGMDSG